MRLKKLVNADLEGKTILYRAPYDIDVKEVNGVLEVSDDTRIRATLPTLRYLLEKNCRIVILTWVGRPDGKIIENLRANPHAKKLSELLNRQVDKVDDCIGPVVDEKISKMQAGDILMLENVRFYKEETDDDDEFAKKLCFGKDLIVFDGFPQAHRIHASTTGIERHLPVVAGLYLQQEVEMLSNILENPARPFTVIIGGEKISDKVDAVNNLLNIADKVLIGGAVANVFLKAQGRELGSSFTEDVFVDEKRREKKDWVAYAKEILPTYKDKIMCPKDLVIFSEKALNSAIAENSAFMEKIIDINTEEIPMEWAALDIGPKTQKDFSDIILQSKTVFLAGPMGKFENEKFATGSRAMLNAMKNVKGKTIIAGGDTIDAARRYGHLEDYSHISLAGGATLEFLAGKELPALAALMQ